MRFVAGMLVLTALKSQQYWIIQHVSFILKNKTSCHAIYNCHLIRGDDVQKATAQLYARKGLEESYDKYVISWHYLGGQSAVAQSVER